MARVAVDFGTSNTVLARLDEGTGEAQTIQVPGITTALRFRSPRSRGEETVHVIPSMIHYGESETLLGAQVLSRNLEDHADTFRWMKRSIAYGVQKRKKTGRGYVAPGEAGSDFLTTLLRYASDRVSFEDDEFTFTVPVESFDTFRDWLERVGESLGIRRLRILDESTAAVLAYRGAVRSDERFLIFDFGCGTLDVSVVRIDLAAGSENKAIQLGQAGRDLGGMDIDRWIAEDFARRHGLDPRSRRVVEAELLRKAEQVKIALSEGAGEGEGGVDGASVATDRAVAVALSLEAAGGLLLTTYSALCDACERGRRMPAAASQNLAAERGCLGCILLERDLSRQIRETVDRALENAAIKVGLRRSDISKVVVTGGSSLLLEARRLLEDAFEGRTDYQNPFDAVVRGACRGIVVPILQHDYAVESYDRERREYEFKPLFAAGTEYPTRSDAVRFWAKGSYDGMTRIGIKIFEVSGVKRRTLDVSLVDSEGALLDTSSVASEFHYICLNRQNPTFIVADPPVSLARDFRRFLCSFRVDGTRRLLVTVRDSLSGRVLLEDQPVVRL